MYRYFNISGGVGNGSYIYYWKSKGFSDEGINSDLDYYYGTKITVKFNGICLKQDKIAYTHGKIVNIYIAYNK